MYLDKDIHMDLDTIVSFVLQKLAIVGGRSDLCVVSC